SAFHQATGRGFIAMSLLAQAPLVLIVGVHDIQPRWIIPHEGDRSPVRRPARRAAPAAARLRQVPLVLAVGIRNPDVPADFTVLPEEQSIAVRRPGERPVVLQVFREGTHVGAVGLHDANLAVAHKGDLARGSRGWITTGEEKQDKEEHPTPPWQGPCHGTRAYAAVSPPNKMIVPEGGVRSHCQRSTGSLRVIAVCQ